VCVWCVCVVCVCVCRGVCVRLVQYSLEDERVIG
jgi:hypothetical protein